MDSHLVDRVAHWQRVQENERELVVKAAAKVESDRKQI